MSGSQLGGMARARPAATLVLVVGLAMIAAACTGGDPQGSAGSSDDRSGATALAFDDEPVRLGFVNTEGGPLPLPEFRVGAEVAVDLINRRGGVSGAPIELVDCAVDGTMVSSVACAEVFVDEEVDAAFVGFDPASDAMLPTLDRAGIPFVAANSWGPEQRSDPDATLLHSAAGAAGLAPLAYFADTGVERLGVVVAATSDAPGYVDEIVRRLGEQELGLEIEVATVDPDAPDYQAAIGALRLAGVDAVHAQLDEVGCLGLVATAHRVGFAGPLSAGGCSLYVGLVPEAAIGTFAVRDTLTPRTRAGATPEVAERIDEYARAMEADGHGDRVDGFAATTYGAMFELATILERIEGPVTPEAVADALDETVTTPGWLGPDLECGTAPWPDEPSHCRADVVVVEIAPGGSGPPRAGVVVDFHRPLDTVE